jgi:hypothetical protein
MRTYIEGTYFLGPEKGGEKAYKLLAYAMRQTERQQLSLNLRPQVVDRAIKVLKEKSIETNPRPRLSGQADFAAPPLRVISWCEK